MYFWCVLHRPLSSSVVSGRIIKSHNAFDRSYKTVLLLLNVCCQVTLSRHSNHEFRSTKRQLKFLILTPLNQQLKLSRIKLRSTDAMNSREEHEVENQQFSLRMSIPSSAQFLSSNSHFNLNCNLMRHPKDRFRPPPRSGHRIVADSVNLYCFGGYNPAHQSVETFGLFGEVWRFNFATHCWSKLSDAGPLEAASHTMALINDCLIVFGGTGHPWGRRLSNTLHVFHIPSLKWKEMLCFGDVPTPRYGHTMSNCQGFFYIIGGTTGSDYNMNVHRLNTKNLTWENLTPTGELPTSGPFPRYRHEAVTFGDWIYILGGGVADFIFNFVDVPAFNTVTKTWIKLNCRMCRKFRRFPIPRKFHTVVQFKSFAYLCGGFTGQEILQDIWRLELETLQWEKMCRMLPQPLYFHAATVTPTGCMFVFGGVFRHLTNSRSNDLFKMWLVVPSLQEIVWDNLTEKFYKCFSKVTNILEDRTAGFFVPPKYLQRLKRT